MTSTYNFYNIFSPDGKLLQLEYALEALNSSNQIVIARNKNIIVCAAKKPHTSKLYENKYQNIYKISSKVYAIATGIEADVDQVIMRLKNLCFEKEHLFGIDMTPDILCRAFADKVQKLTQSTGERSFAFGVALFGFDNNDATIYCTDTSAICYPYVGNSYGENSSKINKFLEKNLNKELSDTEVVEVAVQGLIEAMGPDPASDTIEVAVLERSASKIVYFDESMKDDILIRIADK